MTTRLVVDNSVVMAWCFEDETNDYATLVLESLVHAVAIVPAIWPLEVVNTLLMAERRQRLSEPASRQFLELLQALPIEVIPESRLRVIGEIQALARTCRLSSYDASYLDLARREAVPLATLDAALIRAAQTIQVPLFDGRQ